MASAAELFNVRGFADTAVSDILQATGLEKGGLYNHFASKDELAVAAFDYAANVLETHHRQARDRAPLAAGKLLAVIEVFTSMVTRPLVRGGCPLLNTAVRSTNVHPFLRNRARRAFRRALGSVADIVRDGVEAGEFRDDVDAHAVASIFFASLEGAVMLSALYDDPDHMRNVANHLKAEVARLAARQPARRTASRAAV